MNVHVGQRGRVARDAERDPGQAIAGQLADAAGSPRFQRVGHSFFLYPGPVLPVERLVGLRPVRPGVEPADQRVFRGFDPDEGSQRLEGQANTGRANFVPFLIIPASLNCLASP